MSVNNTYYLVETYVSQCDYSDGEVIALTPEACDKLANNRIPHRVINDFFSEEELTKDNSVYFFDQIKWFKKFDAFLKNHIDYCRVNNIDLATAHYDPLKYLIDSYVTYSFILTGFFKNAVPSSIRLVTDSLHHHQDYSLYKIFRLQKSFYVQLLPTFCQQYSVTLQYITGIDSLPDLRTLKKGMLKARFKDFLLRLQLKSLLSFIRYRKYLLFKPKRGRLYSKGILFLHTGIYPIDFIVRRAFAEGARVFTMSEDFIFKESRYTQSITLDFRKTVSATFNETIRKECMQAAHKLKQQDGLLAWIDEKCQGNVSALLLPYLDNFINHVCVEDIVKIDKASDFYRKENIDFIVTRCSSGRDSAFILSAVNTKHRLKKICFQHACTAFEQLSLLMSDVYFFDYYVTTDSLSEKYFRIRTNNEFFNHCKIVQSPHYLSSLRSSHLKRSRWFKGAKETIMFAPCDTLRGIYNLNIPLYDPNWYYKFLKELIGYFCERWDKIFIFKYRPGFGWVERVLVPYIKSKNIANIRIENKPLVSYLHRVDRIILDWPSTGFFESVAAGMPTLSLYWRSHPLGDEARDFFGPMLQPFRDAKEAIGHIDSFLASDKKEYVTELPLVQSDIADLFHRMEISGRNRENILCKSGSKEDTRLAWRDRE
jgi:hypothetical protein